MIHTRKIKRFDCKQKKLISQLLRCEISNNNSKLLLEQFLRLSTFTTTVAIFSRVRNICFPQIMNTKVI